MAKIFYTIEEACAKLGKSEADLLALIKSGKLREFRDQDQLKLKVEDVTSLSDSGLDMGSKLKNLSDGSGSFELDLSDSMSPALAQDPKGASPVGPTAPPAIEDDLVLDLGSMASGETPAAAEPSGAGDDDRIDRPARCIDIGRHPQPQVPPCTQSLISADRRLGRRRKKRPTHRPSPPGIRSSPRCACRRPPRR